MRAGKLRHRITIEQSAEVPDSTGVITQIWITFASVWADVVSLSAKEIELAHQLTPEVTYQIETRFIKGVRTDMRIIYGRRIFSIEAVIDVDERHKELRLLCKEVGLGG